MACRVLDARQRSQIASIQAHTRCGVVCVWLEGCQDGTNSNPPSAAPGTYDIGHQRPQRGARLGTMVRQGCGKPPAPRLWVTWREQLTYCCMYCLGSYCPMPAAWLPALAVRPVSRAPRTNQQQVTCHHQHHCHRRRQRRHHHRHQQQSLSTGCLRPLPAAVGSRFWHAGATRQWAATTLPAGHGHSMVVTCRHLPPASPPWPLRADPALRLA